MNNIFPIFYISGRFFSNTQKALEIQNNRKIGEYKQGKVIYSGYECYYLLEKNKAELLKNNRKVKLEVALRLISKKNKKFLENYLVFKDLTNKGYLVKIGLKFGEEFRVYSNKKNEINQKHAKWIVYILPSSKKLDLKEFVSKNRIAHTTGKRLLIAIIDLEEDITYYEINWLKP